MWLVGGIYGCGYQEVGVASGWNLWVWLMSVVVRRYIIDIVIIILTFPYSTCISSFFGSIIPTSLFILKMFFSCSYHRVGRLYIRWDERGFPLTQYITNGRTSRARYTITHFLTLVYM